MVCLWAWVLRESHRVPVLAQDIYGVLEWPFLRSPALCSSRTQNLRVATMEKS